jgi:hypothetical protein
VQTGDWVVETGLRQSKRHSLLTRHPELVSGFKLPLNSAVEEEFARWMLERQSPKVKQVQHYNYEQFERERLKKYILL